MPQDTEAWSRLTTPLREVTTGERRVLRALAPAGYLFPAFAFRNASRPARERQSGGMRADHGGRELLGHQRN